MVGYVIKRFIASLITIFIVITATFFLMRLMPGSPFTNDKLTPQIKANMDAKYGLDKPLIVQYKNYLVKLAHGDLGPSLVYKGRDVKKIITYSFPTSAKVGILAIIVSSFLGISLGILSALKQGKWPDKVCTVIATLGITVPSFVLSAVLILYLGVKWNLISPITGLDHPQNYIMPVIALCGGSFAFITRLTRSRLIEVNKADYMRTAKAKGLSSYTIIVKHGLRNSLIPVVTYIGFLIADILTGSFVVEKIFAIPGLGNEFVSSVSSRDYTTLLGVTIFYCTLIILCNFAVDILYGLIDPRIKVAGK